MEENDWSAAVGLAAEFTGESLGEYGTELDVVQLQCTMNSVWKTSFVAVYEGKVVGVLAGRFITDFCSTDPVYEELIWYVTKQHRRYGLKLLEYVENWCIAEGTTRLVMGCMHNSKTEKLYGLYEKLGFKPMETRFIKVLK